MHAHVVQVARREDIPEAVSLVEPAFRADPLVGRLFPGLPAAEGARRYRQLELANVDAFYQGSGLVHIGRDDAGRIATTAVWASPITPATRLCRVSGHLARAARAAGRWALSVARTDFTYSRHRPAEPHWYLHLLATAESARGTGLTGAVLRAGLNMIDASHAPAYLEASGEHLVGLYEHFGFEVRGTLPEVRGSRPVPMYRPAVDAR